METLNFLAESDDKNKRLDVFLSEKIRGVTRSYIKRLIDADNVTINNQKAQKAGYKLKLDDNINAALLEIEITDVLPKDLPIEIVYEDENLAVVNKPQGMTTHPARGHYDDTLVNALLFKMKSLSGCNGEFRPGIVHRLDKDTSGLLVIAKNDKSHFELSRQINDKTCKRIYRAIVVGKITKDEGVIETYLDRGSVDRKKVSVVNKGQGRLAVTHYKVIERFNGYSLVEFELKTGRTHQIRVHCKYIGHPVLGDPLYGVEDKKFGLTHQCLHAYKLEFTHPVTGESMSFTAPPPANFESVLQKLQLN